MNTLSEKTSRPDLFRRNLAFLLRRRRWSAKDLCDATGLERHVVRRWLRQGTEKPRLDSLAKLARTFGLDDPQAMFTTKLAEHSFRPGEIPNRSVDRSTNPNIDQMVRDRPELFADFEESEWIELFSQHGTGGPLTPEGVAQKSQHIQEKRSLRRQFETLLETHHFPTLKAMIELMYRESSVLPTSVKSVRAPFPSRADQ